MDTVQDTVVDRAMNNIVKKASWKLYFDGTDHGQNKFILNHKNYRKIKQQEGRMHEGISLQYFRI